EAGDLILQSRLERTTLLLNNLPGVRAETSLVAGQSVGASDLVVSLSDRPPWSARISANNYASEGLRAQLVGTWRNPRGYGDELAVSIGRSTGGTGNGSAAYTAPIGGQGLNLSLGFAASE